MQELLTDIMKNQANMFNNIIIILKFNFYFTLTKLEENNISQLQDLSISLAKTSLKSAREHLGSVL